MSEEKIYFKEGDLSVTESIVNKGNNSFQIKNISDVEYDKDGFGGSLFLIFLSIPSFWGASLMLSADITFMFYLVGLIGLGFALAGVFGALSIIKEPYSCSITIDSDTTLLLRSKTEELPKKVKEAISNAISML